MTEPQSWEALWYKYATQEPRSRPTRVSLRRQVRVRLGRALRTIASHIDGYTPYGDHE